MNRYNLKTSILAKILYSWPILSFLSSIFLILAFPTPGISFLAWFALVPFFLIIIKEKLGKVIISSIIINFTFNFFYLIWLKEYKQPLTLPLSLIAELLYLMPQAILAWVFFHLAPKYFKIFSLSSIWIIFDYLKTVGFLAFPWGIIGYTQYNDIFIIQSASIFGVWGIDFILIFFNSAMAIIIEKIFNGELTKLSFRCIDLMNFYVAIILIIISLIYGFIVIKKNQYVGNKSIKLSLIQANFNPWSPNLIKSLRREFKLTIKSLNYNPDMIIWSESSVPFPFDYYYKRKNGYAMRIDSFIRLIGKPFIFGSLSFKGIYKNDKFVGKFYNVAYYYKPGKGYSYYRKIHLVPFGEWFPYKKLFPFAAKILENAGAGDFNPGTEYKIFKNKNLNFSVLICFEDVFGNLVRKFVKNGSKMIINITNDAWSGSKKAEIQHFSIAIFRAIENRVPLVRVANGGVTVYIDPYGRIIKELPLFKSGFLVCDVKFRDKNIAEGITFYTKYGDILPIFLFITTIIIIWIRLIRKIVDIILNRNNM